MYLPQTVLAKTCISLSVAMLAVTSVSAADWGSIKGRFVVEGAPPKPEPLVVTKDQFCIDKKPVSQALVVGAKGELANAVVYLRVEKGKKVDVHPDYEKSLAEPAVLDNKGCEFLPHISLIRVGQPFIIKNSDPLGHNTNAVLTSNGNFNELIAQGEEKKKTFAKSESLPMPVSCNIHPFMQAHMLVQDHPYMVASGADGSFEIKNVPAGKQKFQFWHEKSGYLKNVKLTGGTTDRKGQADLTIAAGQTLDLGDIKIPVAALKK